MANFETFDELEQQLEAVLNSESTDFFELAAMLDLDPKHDFSGADLSGVNFSGKDLSGVDFTGANLRGADLSGANFTGANLRQGNFTSANCIGTNFTAANFTGAFLQGWYIDSTTILKDIECQFVYLLENPDINGNYERRPHDFNKNFQPGDFESFFQEASDSVQILISNGIKPKAFQSALEKIMSENPGISHDSIRRLEKQGENILMTIVVPLGSNKDNIIHSWRETYETNLKVNNNYDKTVNSGIKLRASKFKTSTTAIPKMRKGSPPIFSSLVGGFMEHQLSISGNALNMNGVNDLDGVDNLGDIVGQTANSISQLSKADSEVNELDIQEVLLSLKEAIETEMELSDNIKVNALREVSNLAFAAQNPEDEASQIRARMAIASLRAVADILSDSSRLASVCRVSLPIVLSYF